VSENAKGLNPRQLKNSAKNKASGKIITSGTNKQGGF
jgi:hypothetical protein